MKIDVHVKQEQWEVDGFGSDNGSQQYNNTNFDVIIYFQIDR